MRRPLAAAVLVLLVAACGRYGPPQRIAPQPRADQTQTAASAAELAGKERAHGVDEDHAQQVDGESAQRLGGERAQLADEERAQ